MYIHLEKIDPYYRKKAIEAIQKEWNGDIIVSKGRSIELTYIPGWVALEGQRIIGILTYEIIGTALEIVTLDSFEKNRGVGGGLLLAAKGTAIEANCDRIWLITTNDNTNAMRFYQRRGFTLKAVHLNAIESSREIKPSIPHIGIDGIPILHEFEFEMTL